MQCKSTVKDKTLGKTSQNYHSPVEKINKYLLTMKVWVNLSLLNGVSFNMDMKNAAA
jgi:hypothetical protein